MSGILASRSLSMSQAEELAHRVEMIRKDPLGAVDDVSKDPWQRWLLYHGLGVVTTAGLTEWESAALRCIVRHSGEVGRIPQHWLFEGGPDKDPALAELSCLDENARKTRLTRLISKLTKLRREQKLAWKLERAVDCSKEIGTAYISTVTMRRFPA